MSNGKPITVTGVIEKGVVYDGATLKIVNAIGDQVEYGPSYDLTPSVSSFVSQYSYSEDVVLGGQAACYFDVLAGKVSIIPALGNGPAHIMIEIETDKSPVLQVTPFRNRATAAKRVTVHLERATDAISHMLLVGNMDLDSRDTVQNFDYLLHYLTARGGIPKVITWPPPGLTPDPPRQSASDMAKALQGLAAVIENGGRPTVEMLRKPYDGSQILFDYDLTSACSDSRYP
ncbi:MAG TPA: hypothetical protein VGQ46_09105 [Thermoanaerobaculia bacterium]|nr:hypothetical protein [Thermoanaerobaculia bacterium]